MDITISYAGFSAVCLVWFGIGFVVGLWICLKRDLKNDGCNKDGEET